MRTVLPAWQLTTSELAREITALEAPPDGGPPGADEQADGRLRALHAERDRRARLAAHLTRTAGQHPEDDEPW
jgi:hypothetical protein